MLVCGRTEAFPPRLPFTTAPRPPLPRLAPFPQTHSSMTSANSVNDPAARKDSPNLYESSTTPNQSRYGAASMPPRVRRFVPRIDVANGSRRLALLPQYHARRTRFMVA